MVDIINVNRRVSLQNKRVSERYATKNFFVTFRLIKKNKNIFFITVGSMPVYLTVILL